MKESLVKLLLVGLVCAAAMFALARESRGEVQPCMAWLKANVTPDQVVNLGVEGPVLVVELKDSSLLLFIPEVGVELTEEGKRELKLQGNCIEDGAAFNIFKVPPKSIESEMNREIPNERT